MVVKDLRSLKYSELQRLAKNAGIRANQKIDKLIKALEEHYVENPEASPGERVKTPPNTDGCKTAVPVALRKLSTPHCRKTPVPVGLWKPGTPHGSKTPVPVGLRKPGTPQSSKTPVPVGLRQPGTPQGSKTPVPVGLRQPGTPQGSKTPVPVAVRKSGTLQLQHSAPINRNSTSKCVGSDGPGSGKQHKKRRRTFELEEPTMGAANTPTSDVKVEKRKTRSGSRTNTPIENGPEAKRQRRNTYDKTDSPAQAASPGTASMIASMDANQDSAERKANLLSAIDKKIQSKVTESPMKSSQPSQIPRFMAYLASMKKEKEAQQPKPVTPGNKDWSKIHKKEFSKFDSLDVYLEKKQQRKDLLSGSGKKVTKGISGAGNSKIAKPVVKTRPAAKAFVPSVTSVKNMTFNFGATPSRQANTSVTAPKSSTRPASSNKTSKLVTPANNASAKLIGSTNRATPFKFTGGNISAKPAPESASKKSMFDLKASLAKPLSWKPHTGKLQPLDFNTTGLVPTRPATTTAPVKPTRPLTRPSRQAMAAKTRPNNVKNVRRVQQLDRRNNQKYIDMMRRRGLME